MSPLITPARFTPEQITADLYALGVKRGDTLMLHASLRAIGPVEGGAPALIGAIAEAVGPEGTLLMILGAELDWYSVNHRPEQSVEELLEITTPFDALHTPALNDVGYLAEAFRRFEGVLVTHHPDARFAARGARARELLHDSPWDHYYGPDSVLDRFIKARGRILRLGADENTVTILHFAEYLAELPDKIERTIYFLIKTPDGPQLRAVTSLDNEDGIVPWQGEDYFALIFRAYLDTGRALEGCVGNAKSELIDAADIATFGARWMEENMKV